MVEILKEAYHVSVHVSSFLYEVDLIHMVDTLKIDLHVRMKEFSMHGVTPRFKWPRYPKKKNKKSAQQTTLSVFVDLFPFD